MLNQLLTLAVEPNWPIRGELRFAPFPRQADGTIIGSVEFAPIFSGPAHTAAGPGGNPFGISMKNGGGASAAQDSASAATSSGSTLREEVHNSVDHYFANMERESVTDLHRLVMSEVESSLLANVMRRTGNNQSRAAMVLGLNRGTLRARLKQYGLI